MKNLKSLISDSIEGKAKAQRQLYLSYRVKWYMVALRYGNNKTEADDILQEGLIQIFNSLHQFNQKKSQFITWSSRVIAHAALKFLKRNSWYKMVTSILTPGLLLNQNLIQEMIEIAEVPLADPTEFDFGKDNRVNSLHGMGLGLFIY